MTKWRIAPVHPKNIGLLWHLVETDIERACKYSSGTYDSDAILQELMGSRSILWVIHDEEDNITANYVTQLVQYPRKKTLLVVTLGGKGYKKWHPLMLEELAKYAKEEKCDFIEASIRQDLAEWAERVGWVKTRITMEYHYNGRKD